MQSPLGLTFLTAVLSFELVADPFVRAAVADDEIVNDDATVISPEHEPESPEHFRLVLFRAASALFARRDR